MQRSCLFAMILVPLLGFAVSSAAGRLDSIFLVRRRIHRWVPKAPEDNADNGRRRRHRGHAYRRQQCRRLCISYTDFRRS
jgi:hypothetical protein